MLKLDDVFSLVTHGQMGYKLYDLDYNNFTSQDVKFLESIVSFHKLPVDPPNHYVIPSSIHEQTHKISPPHSFDTSLSTIPTPSTNKYLRNLSNSNEHNHTIAESHDSP